MKDKKKIVGIICKVFFVLTMLVFAAGLAKTVFIPEEMNEYENRYANKLAELSLDSYMDESFQNAMEDALADQIHLSTTAKKWYNTYGANCANTFINAIGRSADHYVHYQDKIVLGDYVLNNLYDLSEMKGNLDKRLNNLNETIEKNPGLEFYVYYIEKETDVDLLSGENAGIYAYIKSGLNLPDDRISAYTVNSFDEYSDLFYKTDHHWNYKGSYRGYTELADFLGFEPMKPSDEKTFSVRFAGSKSFGAKEIFNEEFSAYNFDFPPMSITSNGKSVDDYGVLWGNFDGDFADYMAYGVAYGEDIGCLVFDTESDRENILIIGESYDNAIVKLLASHYNETYSVDLRHYARITGSELDISEFAAARGIQKVLLIGSGSFFTSEDFMLVNN